MNTLEQERLIRDFLLEDIGRFDLTTDAVVPDHAKAHARLKVKADGVIAGLNVARDVFKQLDPHLGWRPEVEDGGLVQAGDVLVHFRGNARALLTGERVALNLLQRLSGIATVTREAVEHVRGSDCLILDTRKTTPGLRSFEKYAVRVGGGRNHRFALDDAVMVKDNHIAFAGGILKAVQRIREQVGPLVKIEVEVETMTQVEEALSADVDVIMLDNMDVATMRDAVQRIGKRAFVEASGNMTPERVAEVAASGVNAISLGWLTHSARALDISMELEEDYS